MYDMTNSLKIKRGDALLVNQVTDALRCRLPEWGNLPCETSLAKGLGVSRDTLRRSMKLLKNEGLIASTRGRGTFVTSPQKTNHIIIVCNDAAEAHNAVMIDLLTRFIQAKSLYSRLVIVREEESLSHIVLTDLQKLTGVLVVGHFLRDAVRNLTKQFHVPVVMVADMDEKKRSTPFCHQIIPNSAAAAREATLLLLRRGVDRVLLQLPEREEYGVWENDTIEGWKDAFESSGKQYKEEWILSIKKSQDSTADEIVALHQRLNTLLSSESVPTGLVHCQASEILIRDMLEGVDSALLPYDRIVATVPTELLYKEYAGFRYAIASTCGYETITRRAIELLMEGANIPPQRELIENTRLFERKNGQWEAI